VAKLQNLRPEDFAAILEDLALEGDDLVLVDPAPLPASETRKPEPLGHGPLLVGQIGGGLDADSACARYRDRTDAHLPADAPALFFLKDRRADDELARWRNALWPWLHVVRIYRVDGGVCEREILQGRARLDGACAKDGVLLVGWRREHVLSPEATARKFDANAAGWNPRPGEPGYAHFRWMRKYVADFAQRTDAKRVLDFGCGAGWVGIEAALTNAGATLCAFDPSPEMISIASDNAGANGIATFEGRAGFGEDPPFPAAGEERFDLVISSGVVSFSPDVETWADGLARTVAPGGCLVVGDINRDARGMQRRRGAKVLLPAREMNALTAAEMRAVLEARGFACEQVAGYQLTWPIPQAMHWSDTRAKGAFSGLLLAWNKLRAGGANLPAFDSWVMRLRAPR
jgi:2-polyprenyl-3-methyl-5-hydroxy-6-metoxy-1,4-benzoquinol methylase